jgi:hypothetical protein
MVTISAGLENEGDYSGKAQKQLYEYIIEPSSRQGGRTSRNQQMSDRKKIWSWVPDGSPTPR